LFWEDWFICGASITGNICWFGSSGSFTELLFTGNMCWYGSSGSFTELQLTGKYILLWEWWFIYGAAILRKHV
jgi:hypothetical protein